MSITGIKGRLAHVKETSWRYKLATLIWPEEKVNSSKACKFYWVIIPSSAILSILAGILFALVTSVGWFLGSTPTLIDNTNPSKGEKPSSQAGFYKYKYSPRRGKFRRFAPWQYVMMLLVVVLTMTSIFSGKATAGGSAVLTFFTHNLVIWFGSWWWTLALGALALLGFWWLGRTISSNRKRLSAVWNRLCPDLVVEEQPSS